jgi:hypothetical protein
LIEIASTVRLETAAVALFFRAGSLLDRLTEVSGLLTCSELDVPVCCEFSPARVISEGRLAGWRPFMMRGCLGRISGLELGAIVFIGYGTGNQDYSFSVSARPLRLMNYKTSISELHRIYTTEK